MLANLSDQRRIGRNVRLNGLGIYDGNMTIRQASEFDANIFCNHISQLTQLMSKNFNHPERFDQMIY